MQCWRTLAPSAVCPSPHVQHTQTVPAQPGQLCHRLKLPSLLPPGRASDPNLPLPPPPLAPPLSLPPAAAAAAGADGGRPSPPSTPPPPPPLLRASSCSCWLAIAAAAVSAAARCSACRARAALKDTEGLEGPASKSPPPLAAAAAAPLAPAWTRQAHTESHSRGRGRCKVRSSVSGR
jgi:hypothetical protein